LIFILLAPVENSQAMSLLLDLQASPKTTDSSCGLSSTRLVCD